MRAWQLQGGFGLERLHLVEHETPTPRRGEVLVRVSACSLNRRDLMMCEGSYNPRQPLPLVPLSDGVGIVEAVGPDVNTVEVGERVAGLFCPSWQAGPPSREALRSTLGGPLQGMLRDYVVLPAEGVARVPSHLSDVEAATLPCAALTAWSALFELSEVRPGQTVLLLGTGGVSLFGLQFAKLAGARTIVVSSNEEKLARVRALGADEVVHSLTIPQWGDRVRELSSDGVDHVLEVGGANTLPQSIRASRVGATLALIGVLGGDTTPVALPSLFMGQRRVQGVFVGHRAGFEAMCRAISAARLLPVVDEAFPFGEAPAAFARMKQSEHFGKLCIQVS